MEGATGQRQRSRSKWGTVMLRWLRRQALILKSQVLARGPAVSVSHVYTPRGRAVLPETLFLGNQAICFLFARNCLWGFIHSKKKPSGSSASPLCSSNSSWVSFPTLASPGQPSSFVTFFSPRYWALNRALCMLSVCMVNYLLKMFCFRSHLVN